MICAKESVRLNKIEVEKNIIKYKFSVSCGLSKYFNTNEMFVEYQEDIDLNDIPESILVIPFVSSVLPLMWLTDSIMWIKSIDKTFYRSLKRVKDSYQEIYDYYPLKGSLISANFEINNLKKERESLVLFSGGLDAQTTYLRHKDENPLLFNIQGWYKINTSEKSVVADKDIKDITVFSEREKLDFLYAKSNFATLINVKYFKRKIEKKLKDNWWHGFQHSMSFISISIPLCFKYGIEKIYIASSFALGDEGRCASYPTTDGEFEFANFGYVIHDGFELTRQEKVSFIVQHQKKINKEYLLKVCTFNEENCLRCEKCIRTILGIIAENGDLKKFGFNINGSVLEHFKDVFEKDIIYFDVAGENQKHWVHIKQKMKDNYPYISHKDVVDWFLSTDLVNKRKKKVFEYRRKNFFNLLIKKIKRK